MNNIEAYQTELKKINEQAVALFPISFKHTDTVLTVEVGYGRLRLSIANEKYEWGGSRLSLDYSLSFGRTVEERDLKGSFNHPSGGYNAHPMTEIMDYVADVFATGAKLSVMVEANKAEIITLIAQYEDAYSKLSSAAEEKRKEESKAAKAQMENVADAISTFFIRFDRDNYEDIEKAFPSSQFTTLEGFEIEASSHEVELRRISISCDGYQSRRVYTINGCRCSYKDVMHQLKVGLFHFDGTIEKMIPNFRKRIMNVKFTSLEEFCTKYNSLKALTN